MGVALLSTGLSITNSTWRAAFVRQGCYFSGYWDTTNKHGRTPHRGNKSAVTEVDLINWAVAQRLVKGLSVTPHHSPPKPKTWLAHAY